MPYQYIAQKMEDVYEFRSSLDLETDRGCALLAVAYLEEELKVLLKKCLIERPDVDKNIFSYNGPLGTFSSKIEMAFFLGKISGEVKNELHLLRKIRNEFGHSPKPIDFSSQVIKDRCNALKGSWKDSKYNPRGHFTASACSILAIFHAELYSTAQPYEQKFEFPYGENREGISRKIEELSQLMVEQIKNEG
jgi:DNA-binding MltR family transcriptional regulator